MSHAQSRLLKAPAGIREGNRRVSALESAKGRQWLPAYIAAIIFVVFALAFVWINHEAVQVGYEISELHAEQAALIEQGREYQVELANLISLDRLERLAKEDLGMISPAPSQVQVIE
jgi:cell division protein FtsL